MKTCLKKGVDYRLPMRREYMDFRRVCLPHGYYGGGRGIGGGGRGALF